MQISIQWARGIWRVVCAGKVIHATYDATEARNAAATVCRVLGQGAYAEHGRDYQRENIVHPVRIAA